MADEPDNDTPPEDADVAAEQAVGDPVAEAEAAEPAAAAEPDASEEATEADDPAPQAPAAAAPADAEPQVQLSSKERRRAARSKHTGEARATRSPEERHAERLLERRKKAVRRRARRLQERAKAAERSKAGGGIATAQLAPVHAPVEGTRRVRQGIVVSDKAEKTITVRIDVARRHRRYQKIVRSSSTLHAHDENNDAHEGDVVRVIESRPLSRSKRWKLVDVVERAR